MLRQLPWLALQAFFIGGALWVDFDLRHQRPSTPGAALFIGIVLAFTATAMLVAWIECYKAFRRWLSKPAGVDPIVSQPLDHRIARGASGDGGPRVIEHRSGGLLERLRSGRSLG